MKTSQGVAWLIFTHVLYINWPLPCAFYHFAGFLLECYLGLVLQELQTRAPLFTVPLELQSFLFLFISY